MQRTLVPTLVAATLAASVGTAAAVPGVITGVVNLHAGPGMRFPIVATAPAQAPVDIGRCARGWCRVAFAGGMGFVPAPFVAASAPAPLPPAAAVGPYDSPLGLIAAPFTALGDVFAQAVEPEPLPAPVAPGPERVGPVPAPAAAAPPPVSAAY